MKNNDPILSRHRIVSDEEWLEARRALLREEKKAMKCHDEFTKRQRDSCVMGKLDEARAEWRRDRRGGS
jgi:predicted dithiol-disulfide oxidoreductase (DUF899 family)